MNNTLSVKLVTWKEALRVGLMIYIPWRLGISVFVAALIGFVPSLALPVSVEQMANWGITTPIGFLADLFLAPWLRFDALWFMKTALNGYNLREPNIQHMPLYPLLMRFLYQISDISIATDAQIISNVAFILALGYFYRLVRLDEEEAVGWRASVYLAIFPTSFFYLVGYPESLFLLGTVGAFYYARRRAWFWTGFLGTISALARPQGVFILLPLLVEFFQQEGHQHWRQWLKAWPLLFIPLSVVLYILYWHFTFGLPAALQAYTFYWRVQTNINFPGQGLWLGIDAVWQGIHPANNGLDLAFALFGVAMSVWVVRMLRPSYGLFMVLNVALVISKPIAEYPLLSMPRFLLPIFPIYILLGKAGAGSLFANRLIVYTWLPLLMFFSAQFALGGWVA